VANSIKKKGDLELSRHYPEDKKNGSLPVVLWHGLGDSSHGSISPIIDMITKKLGVFVFSVATGEGAAGDMLSSYYGNVNDQVAKVCAEMKGISELANGFNAIGFSQGGQFMRALVERCSHDGIQARSLITLGAQHQGIASVPGCSPPPSTLNSKQRDPVLEALRGTCETVQALLAQGAYLPWVRDHVVPAQYWKDTDRMGEYLEYNHFLPDINNEYSKKNPQYAANIASLDKLVLYKFSRDTTVVPSESSWFGLLNGGHVVKLHEQDLYKEDFIGLRQLDESGRLELKEIDGEHMNFTLEWFESEILQQYLA